MNKKSKEELLEEISQLKEEISKIKKNKRYGLVWEEKPEIFEEKSKNALPILREKGGKFNDVISDPEDNFNILIEGDNYHSLSVLSYTHKGKIDVIYIDPPYNTGNKDFIYNDTFVDKEDTFRHSKWLSFMSKRLKLAKDLLKDEGVIFISIDDNEQAQLKLLMDDIFGENKFTAQITVETGAVFGEKSSHVNKTFVKVKDYVIVYQKQNNNNRTPLIDKADKYYDDHFNTYIKNGIKMTFLDFLKQDKKSLDYFNKIKIKDKPIKITKENVELLMFLDLDFRKYIYEEVSSFLYQDAPYSSEISIEDRRRLENGEIIKHKNNLIYITNSGSIRRYVPFSNSIRKTDDYKPEITRSFYRGDLWKGFNEDNKNIQDEGSVKFNNGKKPIRLIKNLLKWSNYKNGIILDFFAGSGTTGHAVLDINKEDGGNRKFILCTNNENNICEDVTWERIKKVSQGYKKPNGEKVDGLGGNIKYLKTDFIKLDKNIDDLKERMVEASTEILCLKENSFNKVKDNYKKNRIKIFENKNQYTAILFDLFYIEDFIKELEKLKDKKVVVYVFSYGKDFSKDEFGDLDQKIDFTVEAIPEKILETYQRIFNF